MAIHFDLDRMAAVISAHDKWWLGELERPLVKITLTDAHPIEKPLAIPTLSQKTCADLSISPEEIIDKIDENLSACEFFGDAFPFVNFDAFGPGVLAAFCGAKLDNSSGDVWFFPKEEMDIRDIHIKYDPENIWTKRIKSIYKAGYEKWGDLVVMGMPDLGGVLDVAATFRGSENLLIDLYDAPEEVLRLADEIQTAWYEAYRDLRSAQSRSAPYSDWIGLLSSKPSYVIQCDFSYMISNEMFRQFALNTLKRDTEKLTNTIYHLDGIGELNHLNTLLSLESLNAVQWVAGAGQPCGMPWIDIYRKIKEAGKQMMILGSANDFLEVLSHVHGSPYFNIRMSKKDIALAETLLCAR